MRSFKPLARSLFAPISAIAVAAASATAQIPVVANPETPPPKSIRLTSPAEAPLVDAGIPNSTLPVVEVMINGRGPYRFGVETGAGFIAVSPGFPAKAALASAGESTGLSLFQIDSMTFGGMSFNDFRVAEMPRGATGVDGILGLPFFHDVLLTIDYPARKLGITRDTLPVADGQTILQLSKAGPFWAMPIEFAGKKLRGVLDTRATGSLSIVPELAATLPFETELQVVGRAGGAGIPDAVIKAGKLAGDVKLGRYTFTRPNITSRALPPMFPKEPLVGDIVLRQFVVSLDQKNGRLRLERSGSTVIELPQRPGRATPATASSDGSSSALTEYVGEYGERTVSMRDGKLYIQRPGGQALELRQTGPDAFTVVVVPDSKIEFTRGPNGIESIRALRGGVWEESKRSR